MTTTPTLPPAALEAPLVAAARQGDGAAIDALWERHRRWVAAVILAHKPRFEDLEDLIQEVAVTFISKVHTLRDDANLRAWLRIVAVNAARAAGRSGKYRPRAGVDPAILERAGAAVDDRERTELSDQAEAMLERVRDLPETYREPLLLRAMHGMRSKQIGELLGIPPATVDTRIARARRMLREPRLIDELDAESRAIERAIDRETLEAPDGAGDQT